MGRTSRVSRKRKQPEFYTVERVLERRIDKEGNVRYLTSWVGYDERTWEPIECFTPDARELVVELERCIDEPDENPKPQWLIDHEDQKARGVNILNPRLSGGSLQTPSVKRDRKEEESDENSSMGRRMNGGENKDGGEETETETRDDPTNAVEKEEEEAILTVNPPQNLESSGASTRRDEGVRAEGEEGGEENDLSSTATTQKVADEQECPASSSTDMQVPPSDPPTLASSNDSPAVSQSSPTPNSKIDSVTEILNPIESKFARFNWISHIRRNGGNPAPLECFWKRRLGQFRNPFKEHIGKLVKIPDGDQVFSNEFCTVGVVASVHGPWVKIHVLDTDPDLARWFLADDACIQPFSNIADKTIPRCKEPAKRQSEKNYKRLVENAMFLSEGTDMRVAANVFDQIPWEDRPTVNKFEVGHKLEAYHPIHGEGCFYPATVVEINTTTNELTLEFDHHPDRLSMTIPFNDYHLFPCGFASAIGWQCALPEATKKEETRGRKKSVATKPVPIAHSSSPRTPLRDAQTPNDQIRVRSTRYREERSTENEISEDEEEQMPEIVSPVQSRPNRAPVMSNLIARNGEKKEVDVRSAEVKRKEQPSIKMVKPAEICQTPTMREFEERSGIRESSSPITAVRLNHSGQQVTLLLNHNCSVGVHLLPAGFSQIPSKSCGSLPHIWREILQQLLNCSVDSKTFVEYIPKYNLPQHNPCISVTYDISSNETMCHFLVPPPSVEIASDILSKLMAQAGMCPNAISFGARRDCSKCRNQEPVEAKVLDILRAVKQQSLLSDQAVQQQQKNNRQERTKHPITQPDEHLQQNVRQVRLKQPVSQPRVERVRSTSETQSCQSGRERPIPSPFRQETIPSPSSSSFSAVSSRQNLSVRPAPDDQLLNAKINVDDLSAPMVNDALKAIRLPNAVCDILRQKNVDGRMLQAMTEKEMVEDLQIPPPWARKICLFLYENK